MWMLSGSNIEMFWVFFSQEIVSSSNNSIDYPDTVPRATESVYIKEESIQFETDEEVRSCGVFLDHQLCNFYTNKSSFVKVT